MSTSTRLYAETHANELMNPDGAVSRQLDNTRQVAENKAIDVPGVESRTHGPLAGRERHEDFGMRNALLSSSLFLKRLWTVTHTPTCSGSSIRGIHLLL